MRNNVRTFGPLFCDNTDTEKKPSGCRSIRTAKARYGIPFRLQGNEAAFYDLEGLTVSDCRIVYKNGHVEVLDRYGRFLFSADTVQEAEEDLREWAG